MKRRFPATFLIVAAVFLPMKADAAERTEDERMWEEFADWDGQELSRTYCVSCHVYPEPSLLPKRSWPYLLDLMGLYFGYDDGEMLSSLDEETRADLFDVAKYPDTPTLAPFQWAALRDFYESSEGAEAVQPPPIGEPLALFETSLVYGDETAPVTSLVNVPSAGSGFYLGDAKSDRLVKYDSQGSVVSSSILPGAIVQLKVGDGAERATVIGRMRPSNSATGSILERKSDQGQWRRIVGHLHRPVHALAYDFNRDGRDELLVNEFGHYLGGLSLFDRSNSRVNSKTTLRSEPGSISARMLNLEGLEGEAHLLVLNAQARQDITFYRHQGDFRFEAEVLLANPPSFGYTQLHLIDLTGDGEAEVVTVNGDNADLPGPPLKNYHGIRIYNLFPGPELEERAFLFVPGAFQASFGDFDDNGRVDIAVVSFFPDSRRPEQGFVLFENHGDLIFTRRSIKEGSLAPWMTIGSGDIDGDGDLDIVLGSGYITESVVMNGSIPRPAAMILRNKTMGNDGVVPGRKHDEGFER